MKFGLIDAEGRSALIEDHIDIWAAIQAVGLKGGDVDFGAIEHCLHIIVYQFSLYVPKEKQSYFSINGHLYAGNAVLYATDDFGNTVDLDRLPPITWYRDADAVEQAIKRIEVVRPRFAINDEVLWEWPQPTPEGFPKQG